MEQEVDRMETVLMEVVLERNCRNLMGEIDLMVVDLFLLVEHSFEVVPLEVALKVADLLEVDSFGVVLKVVDSFVVGLEVVLKVVDSFEVEWEGVLKVAVPLEVDSFGVVDLMEADPLEVVLLVVDLMEVEP